MQERHNDWLRSFIPVPLSVGPKEWLRAVFGVGLVVLPMVALGLWLATVLAETPPKNNTSHELCYLSCGNCHRPLRRSADLWGLWK